MVLHFSGRFLLSASLKRRRTPMYISSLTITILVNYTANSGNVLELLRNTMVESDFDVGK